MTNSGHWYDDTSKQQTIKPKHYVYGFIILLILSYFFYFKELFYYNKIMKSDNLIELNSYFDRYPDGRYVNEVKTKLEEVSFGQVTKDSSALAIEAYYKYCPKGKHLENVEFIELYKFPTIAKVRGFQETYPTSKFINQVNKKELEMWEFELAAFEQNVINKQLNPNSKNVRLFRALLSYMKKSRNYKFTIVFKRNLNLKDFSDYSAVVLNEVINGFTYGEDNFGMPYPKPSRSNVFDLKSNFSDEKVEDLEADVFNQVKRSFEEIFTADFFEFEYASSNRSLIKTGKEIYIDIDYQITNEIHHGNLPSLWTYTTQSSRTYTNTFNGYIMGLEADFSFKFINPGTNELFIFNEKGSPGDNISGFNGLNEGYSIMIGNTFGDFISKVSSHIGLF
jgi:hypothetical protein